MLPLANHSAISRPLAPKPQPESPKQVFCIQLLIMNSLRSFHPGGEEDSLT